MVTRQHDGLLYSVGLLLSLFIGMTTAKASSNCSLATLNGTYGDLDQITALESPPLPVVVSGTVTYDGAGNVSATVVASYGGLILGPQTFTGTYIVNPDCTYSDTLGHVGTITGVGVFQQLDWIYVEAPFVGFGTLKKTPPGGCSLASLGGTYEVFGQGTMPFPVAHSATLNVDGKGSFSGGGTQNVDGAVVPGTFTGTYTVDADCGVSFVITLDSGQVVHESGTITGVGAFQEVHSIVIDAGFVFADALKKQ